MQFIKEFIKKKETEIISQSNNAVKILDKDWNNFLKNDAYLIYEDKSTFLHLVENGYKETKVPWYLFWDFKLKSNLKNNIEKLRKYERSIEVYNQNFIIQKKKEYKDLFKKGDLTLDDDQQTAVITDDKHNLVVAGAGSGKTEVLITRIAYLIKRKSDNIKPERILALAFQNKASDEIKQRLKKRYGVDVEIRTFHSLGKKIIEEASKKKGKKAPKLKPECSEDWKYQIYIRNLFEKEISTNEKLQNDIINFMKKYRDEDVIKQESDFEKKEVVKQIPLNISRFIVIAKTYRLYPEDIEKRLKNERWSPKQYSFAKIANQIYEIYQKEFEKGNYIDFSDMINFAVDFLKENKEFYKNKYDHILIDEYQDISTQRYEMIKELMNKNPKCKLFCVGDDWQSIMGFAGSNLDFFINFDKYFSHPARTDLTKNYRSIKSIVEAGACIIKNNKEGQIKKKTISNRDESKPILVFSSKYQKKFFVQYYEQIAKHCLDTIKEYHTTKNYPYDDFMILMRITKKQKLRNFLSDYANSLGIPISEKADKPNCVHIMSVHKSKGLQARVVMILNVDKGLYGFPCELANPDIFLPAIKNNDGLRKQEERRLFYVAVTRAKEEVIIYTQKCSESDFITEIKEFVKREELGY